MTAPPGTPATVLIVSDLHMGMGQDDVTRRFHRRENFFADAAFRAFLETHDPVATSSLLIINGDAFDFLRITAIPESDADFTAWRTLLDDLGVGPKDLRRIGGRERKYGLRTDDYKSAWKLLQIQRGHRGFFAALNWWINRGGRVVFTKGNHDVELHWKLIQQAIRFMVLGSAADTDRLTFEEGALRLHNVHIEHGHRFEPTTAVKGSAEMPDGELRLPLGSFVNRYVINRLEDLSLFLPNIKPVQKLLWSIVRRHPRKVLWIAWYGIPLLRRAARPYWLVDGFAFWLFFLSLVIPFGTLGVIVAAFTVPGVGPWLGATLGRLRPWLGTLGMALPFIIGFLREILPKRKPKFGEDWYADGVYRVLLGNPLDGQYARWYAILGHTHAPDVQQMKPIRGTAPVTYVNSGTWIPRWEEDRPDLMGRIVHTFIELRWNGTEYQHEILEWNDWGERQPAVILEPDTGGRRARVDLARRAKWQDGSSNV